MRKEDLEYLVLFTAQFWFKNVDGKIAPCKSLRLDFQNKSVVLNDDFLFKLSAITKSCSSRVALRELGRKKMTSFTHEFNFFTVWTQLIWYAEQQLTSKKLVPHTYDLGSHIAKINSWVNSVIFSLDPILSMQLDWNITW